MEIGVFGVNYFVMGEPGYLLRVLPYNVVWGITCTRKTAV